MVAAAGLAMGLTAVPFFSMGVFMQPLAAAFRWSRGDLAVAALILATTTSLAAPAIGAMADRWGVRPIGLTGCVVACAGFASLGLLQNSLWMHRCIWIVISIGLALAGPFTWSMGLAGRFERHRGTALALALNGVNIVGAAAPALATALIAEFGWRWAYAGLGIGLFIICFPFAFAVFFDARTLELRTRKAPATRKTPSSTDIVTAQSGLSFGEALRTRQLWLIGVALTVTGGGVVGLIVHLVPLLTDKGMPADQAAQIASAISIAAIVSGACSGFLLDRVFAPLLSAAIFALPVGACLLLTNGNVSAVGALVAAVIIGLASGAEVNLVSYMSARYFGFRSYGTIYGLLFGLFGIGQGISAYLLGAAHDHFGSYRPGFMLLIVGFAASATAVLFLGRYPDFGAQSALAERRVMAH